MLNEEFYRISTKAGKGRYVVNETEFQEFVAGLTKTRSHQEMANLLRDIMTTREIAELIRRWLVGRFLWNGATYEDIIERTGMAPNTVAEISEKLLNGSGVFSKILERTVHRTTEAEQKAIKRREREQLAALSPVDRKFRKMIDPFSEI